MPVETAATAASEPSMNLTNVAIRQLQDAPFPDFVTRPAIDSLVTEARRRLDRDGPHDPAGFAREMAERPIMRVSRR
jgi:cyclopropane-fatty-acyl-phospholipid synthase